MPVMNPSLFSPPSPEEVRALQVAGQYLLRAGREAASKLLSSEPPDARLELWASLADGFLGGAALCDGIVTSPNDTLSAIELTSWTRRLP